MSAAMAIASREIREHRSLLLAAAGAGLLPAVIPLLVSGKIGSEAALTLGLVDAAAFPAAAGLVLGASILARDIAEGRLAFYFARPVSGVSIWAGKMLAAASLAFAAGLLATTPALLLVGPVLGEANPLAPHNAWAPFVLLVWVPVFGIVAAQAGVGMLRSRSGLLGWDLTALVTIAALYYSVGATLKGAGAHLGVILSVAPWILGGLTAILLLASAAQIVVGRTDARRGHLALSAVLWGSLTLGTVVFGLFAAWILSVRPQDVGVPARAWAVVHVPPAGDTLIVGGQGASRAAFTPAFLLNPSSGRFARLGALWSVASVAFSKDGRMAAWMQGSSDSEMQLVAARLDRPEPEMTRVRVDTTAESALTLSEDGSRLVVSGRGGVRLRDTGSGRVLAQTTLSSAYAAAFLSPTSIRVYCHVRDRTPVSTGFAVVDWDLERGTLSERHRDGGPGGARLHDVQGDRLLVEQRASRAGGPSTIVLHDIETGRAATMASDVRELGFVRFLADGRIALATRAGGAARVKIFRGSGLETAEVAFGPQTSATWGSQADHALIVGLFEHARATTEAVFIDTNTGAIVRREPGLSPTSGRSGPASWYAGYDPPPTGPLAGRLFLGQDGGLFLLEPSGERRTVVPPPPGGKD